MMTSCTSSLIRLSLFAMLAMSAYSEMVNQPKCPEDSYSWARARDCSSCANKLTLNCWRFNKEARNIDCTPRGYSVICDCCCTPITPPPPPPSPPPPSPPPPSPPPPSPPPPTPTKDTCDKPGDMYSEITYPSSDCSYCTNWCKEDCAELEGEVVSNKCSMGESKFVTRCKCCCHEKPKPSPPPPPTPTKDTCDKPGDMYSEITNPTSDCTWCKDWCKDDCSEQDGDMVSNKCSIGESKFVTRCQCCCHEKSKPSPPPPPPSTRDTCVKPGDKYSETTYATSDCNDCDDWCKDNCSKQGAEVVIKKCFVPGQSQFLRRCECCCNKPSPPPPPPSTRDTCVKPGDKYSEATYATSNCNDCDDWCIDSCSKQGAEVVIKKCFIPGQSQFLRRCECCCNNSAKPSPPPPPTPTRDTCEAPGDIYTETTFTSSDCSFCKNWCKDDCSELGGKVVSNKCSMGESKFVTRCKCCCNEPLVLQANTVKEIVRLDAH